MASDAEGGSTGAVDMSGDDELSQQYVEWTSDTISNLLEQAAERGEIGYDADSIDAVYQQAHNIKGMGTSFNFPLMTDIGTSLCAYIKQVGAGPWDYDLVLAHLKAFDVVMQHAISGDGGDKGKALISRLESRVAAALGAG